MNYTPASPLESLNVWARFRRFRSLVRASLRAPGLGVLVLLSAGFVFFEADAATPEWIEKVHPRVFADPQDGRLEFIVFMEEQADLVEWIRMS